MFIETFKGLADQTMQVNENLLLVRDELSGAITAVRGEITGMHLKLKDIDHKIDSNYQKLDAKIDSNYQSLDAKAEARHAQILVSSMRWNIGMFIGLAGLIIALD